MGGLLLVAAAPVATLAGAEVLHEPVVVPQLRCLDGACRRDGMPSESMPEAVMSSEGLVGAPEGGRSPEQNEKIYSSGQSELPFASGAPPPGSDPPPVRRAHVRPDSETGPEPPGERRYHEVFNPAVFPYKRMTVVDALGEDGELVVRDPSQRLLPPGDGRVQRGRDPFYASVVVDFVAGEKVALPTPAASVRVVSYRATPELAVRFYTDHADNLFALAAQGGRHRLVYLVDAEPRYFAGPLWERGAQRPRIADVPRGMIKELPRRYAREARTVLRRLRVSEGPAADYGQTLDRLVEYFRAFKLEELDSEVAAGESMYLRLALQQRGACRHRSYAFVITALAAGIPARYVENELHVFVEVFIPILGPSGGDSGGYWRRINLGGAPLQQRVVEGENKVAYHEKGGDPFQRPPEFLGSATPKVAGLPRQGEDRRRSENGSGNGSGPGSGSRDALPRLDGPEDRARRGEGPPSDTGDRPGTGKGSAQTNGGTGQPAAAGPEKGSAGNGSGNGSGPAKNGSGSGSGSGAETAGHSSAKNDPGGTSSASAGDPGEDAASEFPPDDDVAQPEDRRRDPASESLVSTTVTVEVSAARRVYRGMAIPVRGQVRAGSGSAAGLQVVLFLAIPKAPQVIGRAFTAADGTYQTELEIPAGVPLGSYPLVARVRGDQSRRGSATGRYDRPAER